jgi:phosphate transport system protein
VTWDILQQKLERLQKELLQMGELVEEAIELSVQSLLTQDSELAEQVILRDDEIDTRENQVEDLCLALLATQQPLARDLRSISTILKISTDLERMADHAVDVAKATLRIGTEPLIKPLIDIPRMAKLAQKMVRDSLTAFIRNDCTLAKGLAEDDHQVDHLYNQIFRELLVLMLENPKTIRQATVLLFVGQHLERIADHATNIGEWVIYASTGEKPDLNP